jgi:hypothetical protein
LPNIGTVDADQHGAPDPGIPAAGPRASDHDREQALELLSTAAGDGRLTLEEYSARADRALGARLVGELSELTADLQRAPEVPARGRTRWSRSSATTLASATGPSRRVSRHGRCWGTARSSSRRRCSPRT